MVDSGSDAEWNPLGGLDGEFIASKWGDEFVSKVGDSSRKIGKF